MNNGNKRFYSENGNAPSEKLFIPKQWFFSRILCLIVAFAIWIYVVNVTTQDYEKTFNLIDISVEGWEELLDDTNLSVVNLEESKISVTVKGLRSDISKLTPSDFNAYIDISDLTEGGKHSLEVSVDLPSTVSLVSKYPESVTISIDENIQREIEVEIDVTEYSMDTIYEMGVPECDVTSVMVTGPSEVLDRVKSAKAYINLGTVMTSTVIRTEIVLVDKVGNSIDSPWNVNHEKVGLSYTSLQNGIATLADRIFISDDFSDLEPELIHPILKASTGEEKYVIVELLKGLID